MDFTSTTNATPMSLVGQIRKCERLYSDDVSMESELLASREGPKRIRSSSSSPYESDASASTWSNSSSGSMESGLPAISTPSPDEVLTQMIAQSGAKSFSEVVDFCRSSGIPVSRMLRLDLMRQLSQSQSMETD